jgi:hypothetical protein
LLNVSNQPQFAEVLSWFVGQDRFNSLLRLMSEGTIQIYEYSFFSAALFDQRIGRYILARSTTYSSCAARRSDFGSGCNRRPIEIETRSLPIMTKWQSKLVYLLPARRL